ncbi:MAG TPA: hypothetical protein VLE53_18835 [Gemmatimonadaceae bacterium]|nr:hypothetical protein [Gemmatimonadaceae bacterium]
MLPWVIGGLAFVVLVVIVAAQRAGTAPAAAPAMGTPLGGGGGAGGAPDISAMTPRERADRLFDRLMRMDGEGKRDSVAFFAPMALGAYESLGELDLDLRYDYGRVAEVSGNLDLAAAQADTILRQAPDHLLGLVLAMRVAERRGDEARRRQFADRLLSVEAAERKKDLDEYRLHQGDLEAAIAAARARR